MPEDPKVRGIAIICPGRQEGFGKPETRRGLGALTTALAVAALALQGRATDPASEGGCDHRRAKADANTSVEAQAGGRKPVCRQEGRGKQQWTCPSGPERAIHQHFCQQHQLKEGRPQAPTHTTHAATEGMTSPWSKRNTNTTPRTNTVPTTAATKQQSHAAGGGDAGNLPGLKAERCPEPHRGLCNSPWTDLKAVHLPC